MEKLYTIALTLLKPQLSLIQLMQIYQEAGSATALVEARTHLDDVLPEPNERLKSVMANMDSLIKRAEAEIEFCNKHSINILTLADHDYPQRLAECSDAPLVLYKMGNADLNAQRIINIVGTRKSTPYGRDVTERFVKELSEAVPDTLIVSGLAYGTDINAHRAALANNMNTVGVLAHGLDTLYPAVHRETAKKMLSQGGLLTEFLSGERPEKRNFVQRNRIVAGMSDYTILVESAVHGGGLITCGISRSYSRDVYAFPGPVTSPVSEGCNNLLKHGDAQMVLSAEDFLDSVNWKQVFELEKAKKQGIECNMFPELTPTETIIANALQEHGDMHINQLAIVTNLPISTLSTTLLMMEMNGIVRSLAGAMYHLIIKTL